MGDPTVRLREVIIAAAPLVVMVGVWFSNYLKHR